MKPGQQGVMLWEFNGRGETMLGWLDRCPTCGDPTREPHDHSAADLEKILAELRRLKVEQPAPSPEPVGEREHMTRKQLETYSGYSAKWLLDRTKDPRDPLPCYGRGGKATFKKSDYDRWISRQRPDAVAGIVSEMMTRLGGKPK